MGFISPAPPPFDDVEAWKAKPHLARIKPLAQDWAVNGFGTPIFVYLLYVVKLVVYVAAAALVISATTPGLGGIGDIADWWTQPIVFQKFAVFTLLWEIIGLGCGSMPACMNRPHHAALGTRAAPASKERACRPCTCGWPIRRQRGSGS